MKIKERRVIIYTSKISLLAKYILYTSLTLMLVLYHFQFHTVVYIIVIFLAFFDFILLHNSKFFKRPSLLSFPVFIIKIYAIINAISTIDSNHPSYMLLTNNRSFSDGAVYLSKETASNFLSYRFLSDEQKELFAYKNSYKIDDTKSMIALLNKEIKELNNYKISMQEIVDKGLGSYEKTNNLLLRRIDLKLEYKKIQLTKRKDELTELENKNNQWEKNDF